MKQLICDECRKEIYYGQVYYKVMRKSNLNAFFNDTEKDLCSDCAKKQTVEKAGDEE